MTETTEFEHQPVPVAVAPNEIAAHMLQHVLSAQDIESYVLGGMANQVLYWGGLVEVRIEVRRCDYEVARAALEAFMERLGTSLPEHSRRSHCVVCGYDRAGLGADSLCPECGSEPSLRGIDAGQFHIVGSPGDGSDTFASFVGYAILILVAALVAIAAANLMGYI